MHCQLLSCSCILSSKGSHLEQQTLIHSNPSIFDDDVIKGLKDELVVYLSKCADTDPDFPLSGGKGTLGIRQPGQHVLARPSSAASECDFAILQASFHKQQDNSLQDYIH